MVNTSKYIKTPREITVKPFMGETYAITVTIAGFRAGYKSIDVIQEEETYNLPLSMFSDSSLIILRKIKVGQEVVLQLATGIVEKMKLTITIIGSKKKEKTVSTPWHLGIQGGINIIEQKVKEIDTNCLTYRQVYDKLQEMGRIQKELSAGKYVTFTLSGNELYGLIQNTINIKDYVRD